MKKKLAYINPDCYIDVDLTILKHLTDDFEIIWYPVYYTDRPIYYTAEQMRAYADKYGIELHLCPRLYRQRDPRNLRFYGQIVEEINSRGVDIVYSCIAEEWYWTVASRKLKAPLALGLHDVVMHNFNQPVKRFIQTAIRKRTIRRADHVCVFSENQQELFRNLYGREAFRLSLINRCLGDSTVSLPHISDGVRLLFFGNIVQYKGLDLLIGAMERLRQQGITNLKLTIAGKGDFWKECEPLIHTPEMYNLQVRFVDNAEIPDLLASHHFMILPYRDATQSGPLMIASGHGMPVIAPSFGCFLEYCDMDSDILYSDLNEALRQVADLTEAQYLEIRNRASVKKTLFSEETVARRYLDFFSSSL